MTLKISKTLISKEEIENRISEIAGEINHKYKGEELVVIGILKGAFIVASLFINKMDVRSWKSHCRSSNRKRWF